MFSRIDSPNNLLPLPVKAKATKKPVQGAPLFAGTPVSAPAAGTPPTGLLQAYHGVRFAGDDKKAVPTTVDTSSPDALLESLTAVSKARFTQSKSVMSFKEFLEKVYEDPHRYLPTASSYASRGLKSYGQREETILGRKIPVYNFQDAPWRPDALTVNHGIVAQEEVFHEIIQALDDFTAQGHSNRILLLFGPKGTGKSEATTLIFEALEAYSQTPEGTRHTFSWSFPTGDGRGVPEFAPIGTREETEKWLQRQKEKATGKPKRKNAVILPSNINSHPLFLLPKAQRAELIKTLKAQGKLKENENFDYFINADLDANSRTIFDNLMKQYDGDLSKVYDHVLVESWTLSRQSNRGLAEVPASANRDAVLHQVTPDIEWGKLPEMVRRAGLTWVDGYLASANGGMLNYDDLGRELDSGRYLALLKTAENGDANLSVQGRPISVRESVDIIFLASANPDAIAKLMQERQWDPLKERIRIIPMGHIRRYQAEKVLYQSYLDTEIKNGRKVAPYVLEALSLFLTTTRLLPPNPEYDDYKNLNDPDFNSGIGKLDPLRKALLYQGEDINSYEFGDKAKFKPKEIQRLQEHLGLLSQEYNHNVGRFPIDLFEGGGGLSVRDGQNYITKIIDMHPRSPLTVLDVFEHLADVVREDLPYYELMTKQAENDRRFPKPKSAGSSSYDSWYNPRRSTASSSSPFTKPSELLKLTEEHMRRKTRHEILTTLGIIRTDDDYARMMERYIVHLNATLGKKNVAEEEFRYPDKTSKAPSEEYMQEIEEILSPGLSASEREAFRYRILARLDGFDAEKSRTENVKAIFEDEKQKMMAHDQKKAQEKLDELVDQLLTYWFNPDEFHKQMGFEDRVKELNATIQALKEKGYPEESLPSLIDWAFTDNKYISNGTYKVRRDLKKS